MENKNLDGKFNIGFIGAGKLTLAFVKGFIKKGGISPNRLCISAPSNKNLPKFEQLNCNVTNNNLELVDSFKCEIIFLFVKPKQVKYNMLEFKNLNYFLIIVSAIPGLTEDKLEDMIIDNNKLNCCIYRIMPNLACEVGYGFCAISNNTSINSKNDFLEKLLGKIFYCLFVKEDELDRITALGGSGIAIVYTFIQAMADAGVKIGFDRETSKKITIETIIGACEMVRSTKKHPIELRDDICSSGGTTIYGIHQLEKSSFSSSVFDGVNAAYLRALKISSEIE